MTNIDGHDLCACGSKRKYKDCCMKKIKKIDFFQYKGCTVYPEKFVLYRLKNGIKEFRSFFDEERNNITGYIYWAEHELPEGTNGMAIPLTDGNNLILLQTIPPPTERIYAFAVAHELGHLLRKYADNYFNLQNFRINGYSLKPEIGTAINSMIEDPLVDAILAKYGINLEAEFEAKLRNQLTEMESYTYFNNEIDALTAFTNFKLCCDLIGSHYTTWHECEALLERRFPELTIGIRRIYDFIKENENNIHSNEKKEQLVRLIISIAKTYPARSNLRKQSQGAK